MGFSIIDLLLMIINNIKYLFFWLILLIFRIFLYNLSLFFTRKRRSIYNFKQRLNFMLITRYIRNFWLNVLIFNRIFLFLCSSPTMSKILSISSLIKGRIIISLIITIDMRPFGIFLRSFINIKSIILVLYLSLKNIFFIDVVILKIFLIQNIGFRIFDLI